MILSTVLVSLLLIGVSCNDHSLQLVQWRLTNIEEKQFKDAQMFNNSLNDIKQYMDDKMRCCTEQSTLDEETHNNNMDTIMNNSVINDVKHQVSAIKRAFADQKQFVKNKFEDTNLVNEQILDAKIVECRENIFGSIDKRFNEHDSDIKKMFSGIVSRNKELETSVNIFKEELRVTQIEHQKKQNDLLRQIMHLTTQNENIFSSIDKRYNEHDSDIKKKFSGILERSKELETSVNTCKEELRGTRYENQKTHRDLSRQIMNLRTQNGKLESSVNTCLKDLSDVKDFQNDIKKQIATISILIRTVISF